MTTTRREMLKGLGLVAMGNALSPGAAAADRIRILEARPAGMTARKRHPVLERLVRGLAAGEARQRGALTVVWLHTTAAPPALDVATLDEAQASGALVVTERDRARAPDLVVDNRGKRRVLLLAGEILVGGKQNRVLAEDVLLPARSGPLSVEVYCVEAGRWSGSSARLESRGLFAPSGLRRQILDHVDQQRVWSAIDGYAAHASAPSPTQSYEAVVEQPDVKAHARDVEEDLGRVPAGAVGAAAFVGARLAGLDVLQHPTLFVRLWPKLLRAHAVETYRTAHPGVDAAMGRAQLASLLPALGRAAATVRRNGGEGVLLEFLLDGRRGAALAWRDQVLHLAVM